MCAWHLGYLSPRWLTSVVKPVREELAQMLGVIIPTKLDWKKRFMSSDEGPFWAVVDVYRGRQADRMVSVPLGSLRLI